MPTRSPFAPILVPVDDKATKQNFDEMNKHMSDMSPIVRGALVGPIALAVGNNEITLPARLQNPSGRVVVYQSTVSDLADAGIQNGKWLLFSSTVCTVKLLFF
jgi:hypothetical protein